MEGERGGSGREAVQSGLRGAGGKTQELQLLGTQATTLGGVGSPSGATWFLVFLHSA